VDIFEILATAKAKKASDLHLSAGSPPLLRVNGDLRQMTEFPIPSPEDVKAMFMQITTIEGREKFQKDHELDFKYILPDGTSLRCNAAQERGQLSLSIRDLPPQK
jgi:twitching motility protein PilT